MILLTTASREVQSLGRNSEQMQQMVRERSYGLCQVGVVKSMFPHVPEASIRYDLMVSGSAEVTCDKILQQGYLPPVRPPPLTHSRRTGFPALKRRGRHPEKSHRSLFPRLMHRRRRLLLT